MCYDVSSQLSAKIKYARHRGEHPSYIEELERKLEEWLKQRGPKYHASGFSHPDLMVFTNEKPYEPQGYMWGLIPGFIKDWESAKVLYNKTLNARGETIFQLPSFKKAAVSRRCLIYVDGFFEHHHLGKQTYPFYITMKDDSPMALAGLWEKWEDKTTGRVIHTTTIVTTCANETMAKIHNNPKAEGARMPVILLREQQDKWLGPCETPGDQKHLQSLLVPFPDDAMKYHSVRRLRGKEAVGDVPTAVEKLEYPELAFEFN